jgi:hypothetical protein
LGDFKVNKCGKPAVLVAFLYIPGTLEGLFDFFDPSTTPWPGTFATNSRRIKQFKSRPYDL